MSDLGDQATAIKTIIEGLHDYGVAYDYQPSIRGNALDEFVAHFVVTIDTKTQIRAWTVAYVGERGVKTSVALGATKVERHVDWLVRFFQSWDDTSEIVFRDLVELAVRALNASMSLGGTVMDHTSCSVTMPNQGQGVVLGDYGCHLAEIRLSTVTEESLPSS